MEDVDVNDVVVNSDLISIRLELTNINKVSANAAEEADEQEADEQEAVEQEAVEQEAVEQEAVEQEADEQEAVEQEAEAVKLIEERVIRRGERIAAAREKCNVGQEANVKKMTQMNKKLIKNVAVNDLVLLSVPDVDRGPLDPSNLLCYVIEEKHTLFRLGSRAGILDKFFAFNAFEKTNLTTDFLISDIPKKKDKNGVIGSEHVVIGVREAISLLSVGNGQGFLKCSCQSMCATNRCSCKKAKITCSSKCHGRAFTCKNS